MFDEIISEITSLFQWDFYYESYFLSRNLIPKWLLIQHFGCIEKKTNYHGKKKKYEKLV